MASPAPDSRRQFPPDQSPGLSATEEELVHTYRQLPASGQKYIRSLIIRKKRELAAVKKKGTAVRQISAGKGGTKTRLTKYGFNRTLYREHPSATIERAEKVTEIPRLDLPGAGMGTVLSVEEAARKLEAFTVNVDSIDWADDNLLGVGEVADHLGVVRGSIANWRNAGKVIAFQKGVRNYVYPSRQFKDHAPVKGIRQVLECFATPEDAWEWLVTPNKITHGEPPIELLRADKVDEVARAAEGALDFA